MAVRDDPMSGENVTLTLYRWKEKEVTSGAVNGANAAFTTTQTIAAASGLNTAVTPDFVSGTTYALRDIAVFYRKSGVDTRVPHGLYSITGPTTITFGGAPAAATADSILASYAYTDSANDGTTDFTYYVKDYDVKFGDRDVSAVKVCGAKSYKKRNAQDLTECTLTTIKKDILLSQVLNGNLILSSAGVSSLNIKSTVGGSSSTARCLIIKHVDPDNASDRLITILRNVMGASLSYAGGAEKELEETLTVKANPEDSGDLEVTNYT